MRETVTARAGAGVSTTLDTERAAREAARRAGARLGEVDLAFVFLSPEHAEEAQAALDAVTAELSPRALAGCVAEGVIAGARELEDGPAVSVWAASLPGAFLQPFHAVALEMDDGLAVAGFPRPEGDEQALVVLLADPFSFPVAGFLAQLDEEAPGVRVVGGLALAGDEPGAQALFADDEVHSEGAVGVLIAGAPVLPIVSQGCAPIGLDAVITSAEENVVYELAGEPALERLRSVIGSLSPREQALATQGVLAGLVVDENKSEYRSGDYLMRAVVGADEETGAIAVGEHVRVGQTLRFHVRDASAADRDLERSLDELVGRHVAGALLFSCNGRGTQMFGRPGHDAEATAQAAGGEAVAGMFCGGEIGPVGGRNHLHGFTATMAVFLRG